MPIRRPQGAAAPADGGGLVAVDGTPPVPAACGSVRPGDRRLLPRAAEVLRQRRRPVDRPQPVAPPPLSQVERIAASGRWIPTSMDLKTAVEQLRTCSTRLTTPPALATIFLLAEQLDWMNPATANSSGPRRAATVRPRSSARGPSSPASPVPSSRTRLIEPTSSGPSRTAVDAVGAAAVAAILRANGIVDAEPSSQARAQPTAHRHVPGDRAPRHRIAVLLHHPRRGRIRQADQSGGGRLPGDWCQPQAKDGRTSPLAAAHADEVICTNFNGAKDSEARRRTSPATTVMSFVGPPARTADTPRAGA